jgi:hypothetical protein
MPFVIGRPRTSRMTSDLLALDVFQFHREGALDAGAVTRCRWPHPAAPLDMIVKAEADHIVLSIAGIGEVPVRIEWETVHFGGLRPWWACPTCSSRRRIVHVLEGRAACRQCCRLKLPLALTTKTRSASTSV